MPYVFNVSDICGDQGIIHVQSWFFFFFYGYQTVFENTLGRVQVYFFFILPVHLLPCKTFIHFSIDHQEGTPIFLLQLHSSFCFFINLPLLILLILLATFGKQLLLSLAIFLLNALCSSLMGENVSLVF